MVISHRDCVFMALTSRKNNSMFINQVCADMWENRKSILMVFSDNCEYSFDIIPTLTSNRF